MSGVSKKRQKHIAELLAQTALSLKHAIKDHERGISIESQLAAALSLTSEQALQSCEPFHEILEDEQKDNQTDESSLESDSNTDSDSDSDEKSSSSSDSDDYISIAEQQVPILARILKFQGKFMQIPFDLTGATGVTQLGNLVTIQTSSQFSMFLNKIFNEGIWRIYFQLLKNAGIYLGVAEPSFDNSRFMGNDKLSLDYNRDGQIFQNGNGTSGNKSFSSNDIVGMEIDMISHRIFFFHTFQQQPVCIINIPALLKVGVSYSSANESQFSVVAIYKLQRPLADPAKSPNVKTWTQ